MLLLSALNRIRLKKNPLKLWDGTNMITMNQYVLTKHVLAVLQVYASGFKYLHSKTHPV